MRGGVRVAAAVAGAFLGLLVFWFLGFLLGGFVLRGPPCEPEGCAASALRFAADVAMPLGAALGAFLGGRFAWRRF